jgi:hypothetical protein
MYCKGDYCYVTSFDIIECGEPFIVEIERVTGTKKSILARERYYIENTVNSVNKIIVGRTDKEYYTDNKDKLRECMNEYYKNNKTEIQKHQNKPNICELCNGKYTTRNKSRHLKTKQHLDKIN